MDWEQTLGVGFLIFLESSAIVQHNWSNRYHYHIVKQRFIYGGAFESKGLPLAAFALPFPFPPPNCSPAAYLCVPPWPWRCSAQASREAGRPLLVMDEEAGGQALL